MHGYSLIFFQKQYFENCRRQFKKNFGWGQNLERRNVERPIFRYVNIANITITKNELLDNFIFELIFFIFQQLFENAKYLIIFQIVKY